MSYDIPYRNPYEEYAAKGYDGPDEVECERCGEPWPPEDLEETVRGEYLCPECYADWLNSGKGRGRG